MTTLVTTPVVGLEEIQRAAFYVFFESFNEVLAEVETYWGDRDQIFNQRTGRAIPATALEPIDSANFHEGHKPSLVKGDPSGYPNLAVFAMRADPSAESDSMDQISSWSDSLLVEIMVKAESDEANPGLGEEAVNRRIQRTTEAAMICLRRNETLGGAVTGLESTPTGFLLTLVDVFAVVGLRSATENRPDCWRQNGILSNSRLDR